MVRRLLIVGLVLLLGASSVLAAQETASAPGVDQARQILDQTVEALGGATFLSVRDITRRGRIYSFDRGELASPGDRFVDYLKFPGKERLELGKKGNIIYLNDNDQGWELDRQGVREQTADQIEDFRKGNQRDFEYVLRFRLREEKMQLYYLGREFVDNRRAHVIELVDAENQSLKLVIDARSYLPMQLRYQRREPLSGDWLDVVEYYGKYVVVQGITTPLHITREQSGRRTFEVYLSEVQYNTGAADALFSRASLEERWQKVKK